MNCELLAVLWKRAKIFFFLHLF